MSLKKLWTSGGLWPVGIIAVLTIVVAVNAALLTVALRHKPTLVSKDYYAEGFNLKTIAERKAAGAATGWRVQGKPLPVEDSSPALFELTVTEADGSPRDSLQGEVGFYRPSDKSLDVAAQPLRFVGSGRYLAVLPRPLERGSWQALVHVKRARQELDQRLSFFVE
jgi:nitrogen fixation protein FixH